MCLLPDYVNLLRKLNSKFWIVMCCMGGWFFELFFFPQISKLAILPSQHACGATLMFPKSGSYLHFVEFYVRYVMYTLTRCKDLFKKELLRWFL